MEHMLNNSKRAIV